MTLVAIVCAVCFLIGVPVLAINRDAIKQKLRKRRHRRTTSLPFLFYPTTEQSNAHVAAPAWNGMSVVAGSPIQLQPEPDIADLPPRPQPEIADLPPGYRARRAGDRRSPANLTETERPDSRRGLSR